MHKVYAVLEVYTPASYDEEPGYDVPIRYFTSEASAAKFAEAADLDSGPEFEYVVWEVTVHD